MQRLMQRLQEESWNQADIPEALQSLLLAISKAAERNRKDETDDDTPAPRAKKTRSGLPTGGRSRTRPEPDTPGSEPV